MTGSGPCNGLGGGLPELCWLGGQKGGRPRTDYFPSGELFLEERTAGG